MADRDSFGPSLRREREKRRVSLESIAEATNVSVDLWEGLERNDFSRWPSGVFARAFIRDYARAVGLDADAVVDDFCRLFPLGDRRTNRLLAGQAQIIGHKVAPLDRAEPLPAGRDRRRRPRPETPVPTPERVYAPRVVAAAVDLACVGGFALVASASFRAPAWPSLAIAAALYFTTGTLIYGSSPGSRFVTQLRLRAPSLFTSRRAVA